MIIEAGHFALILALFTALVQATVPLAGASRNRLSWMEAGRMASRAQFALVAIAFGALISAYVSSDFSVLNVVQNSHTDKPLIYKITGVWGNHEGSMLLWVFILALYGFALSFLGGNLPRTVQARALAVQAMISTGFLLFILFTSNPFIRINPPPLNGEGLNPLLQDPGLAFHPPFLYLGYVGFSMAFSFAIAGLMEGRVDRAWARWVRPWTLAAWSFLTLGIAMGSWWAYYTLGWGGWWYWDPVENASFIPWLAGTALLHSALVVEKRGTLKAWTVLLAIITFSLSLIGTFLVRSGVLTSVHSFAADPERGVFILALLSILIGGSFILYFIRAPKIRNEGMFAPISREGALLLNNVLLSTAAGSVLLGTLYPLFIDALGLGRISVGPPFFNIVFIPLMVPVIIAMAVGPMMAWKRSDFPAVWQRLKFVFAASIIVMIATWLLAGGSGKALAAACGLGLSAWLFFGTMTELARRINLFRVPFGDAVQNLRSLPRSTCGMVLAHAGLAIVLAGITGSLAWKTEKIETLRPGEGVDIAGYRLQLQQVAENVQGPNYIASRATFIATKNGAFVAEMNPEHRVFAVPPQPVTSAAIRTNFISDLYAVLGEPDGKGGYVTRFYHNPLVPWIFLGSVVIAFGGFVSLTDRRYRANVPAREPAVSAPPVLSTATTNAYFLAPMMVFVVLSGFFVYRLARIDRGDAPNAVPSVLIGKPAPEIDLPSLFADRPNVKSADIKGKVTLINFFSSWCLPCQVEHPSLSLLKEAPNLTLIGINYEDKPEAARAWLDKMKNPYTQVASDGNGRTAIDFGATGVPETYLVDKQGVVRFREAGPLTPEIVREQILPLVAELNK